MAKLLAHREQPAPDVRRARPEAPAGLAAVLERMLAKKPANRYQTPGKAAAALEPFTRPPVRPPRKRLSLLVALALAAVFGGLLLAGVVVYRILTDSGELVITTGDDDVEVVVKQGGKLVDIIDTKSRQSLRLHSGVYELELKGAPAGLKLDVTSATLVRDKTVVAKIERLPRAAPPAAVAPMPAPLTPPQPEVTEIRLLHHVSIPWAHQYHYVSVARDGKLFAADVGGDSNNVAVWDGQTGKELYRLEDRWACQFTPDGTRLMARDGFTPEEDRTCSLYDAATGKKLRSFHFDNPLDGFWLVPGSRHALIWTRGGETRLCDLETGNVLHRWYLDSVFTDHSKYTDDGRILFFRPHGSEKCAAWDIQQNGLSTEFDNVLKYPYANILPGNKQAIVPAAEVGKYLVLDIADGTTTPFPRLSFPPCVGGESALLDIRIYLVGDGNGKVFICDFMTGREMASLQLPDGERLKKGGLSALSPEGGYACVQTENSLYFLRLVQAPPTKKQP